MVSRAVHLVLPQLSVSSVPITFDVTASSHCVPTQEDSYPTPPPLYTQVPTQEGPHIMLTGALLGASVTLPSATTAYIANAQEYPTEQIWAEQM